MKSRILTLLSAVLCMAATFSHAATISYTDRNLFEAALPTGFYFNDFSTVSNAFSSPVSVVSGSGGTPFVGYEITAPTAGLGVFPETVGKPSEIGPPRRT